MVAKLQSNGKTVVCPCNIYMLSLLKQNTKMYFMLLCCCWQLC